MANRDAYKTLYREEIVDGYEVNQSLLRKSVTTEHQMSGQKVVFLVADSGGAAATTRGADGDLIYRENSNTQSTCTLVPWYDAVRLNSFDIFATQGDQKQVAQKGTWAVINRRIDKDITAILDTATVQVSATAATADVFGVVKAKTILLNADIPSDGNISAAITPAFSGYMLMGTEFNNIDYINNKPLGEDNLNWRDKPQSYVWNGITFIEHPTLTGATTATEKCYFYHKASIGHAFNTDTLSMDMGYDGEHRRSWVNCEAFIGSVKLQNTGIVQFLHNGLEMAAA